jgi:hypothetical protein
VFKLQHLLECNILQHREELEEITTAAVKEQQIEIKLNGIKSDWQALNLVRALTRRCQGLAVNLGPARHPAFFPALLAESKLPLTCFPVHAGLC